MKDLIQKEEVIKILKQCFDPELPVDLWNLGLIYDIKIQEAYDETKSDINIIMSLTTPGCTMGDQISQDVRNKLEALDKVNQAFVEVTFDPAWNPEMITEEAKKKNLKPEWQPGGSRRQELLDKAVEYLKAPIMETQAARHHFCLNNLMMTETEYLEALNKAVAGE